MPMKPQVAAHALNKLLADDAIIAADCGTVTTWAARHLEIRETTCSSRVSGMLATMANGLPYAIGAAVAYPGRQVVAIVGDGGFTMLMGELATIVKYKLPVKVMVIKNNMPGRDQVGAAGDGGQPAVRRRPAADRLRRLRARLRRRRLQRRRPARGRERHARGVRPRRARQ